MGAWLFASAELGVRLMDDDQVKKEIKAKVEAIAKEMEGKECSIEIHDEFVSKITEAMEPYTKYFKTPEE